MKKKKQRLTIPFSGLKLGSHRYEYDVSPEFFEQFEYSIIQEADLKVEINFEKKETLFELDISVDGLYQTYCDRCNDPLKVPLKGEYELIVKFGETNYEDTDEIKIIPVESHELDLTFEVYQFIHLTLPTKIVHENIDDCNSDVIRKLEEINQRNKENENNEIDPRWAALKKLK